MDIIQCLQLLETETANHEKQLMDRQLEIILKLNNKYYFSSKELTLLANACILISRIKAQGTKALVDAENYLLNEEYVLNFIREQPISEGKRLRTEEVKLQREKPTMHSF